MGTTSDFAKLRSTKTPKVGEWNIDYKTALSKAKKEGKFIVALWSNGDACGYCVQAEKCMMQAAFAGWMKSSDAYFVFQFSGDKDKGKTLHDLIYKERKITQYPGFRITLYDPTTGKAVVDQYVTGNTARGSKTGSTGAKNMVEYFKKVFAKAPAKPEPTPAPTPAPEVPTCVRLNEKLTVAQINKILDAIDKNDNYCPCQVKSADTKCHCKDFTENKKIGEPCICKIFVKQPAVAAKKTAARGCKKTTKK